MKMFFDEKKAAHSVGYFCLKSKNRSISLLKLLKLIYLADRKSLEETGHPIQTDEYVSLRNGPANKNLKKHLSIFDRDKECLFFKMFYFDKKNKYLSLKEEIDRNKLTYLSECDIQIMDDVFDQFGNWDINDILSWMHDKNNISEWKWNKHIKKIELYEIYKALGEDEGNALLIEEDVRSLQEIKLSFI